MKTGFDESERVLCRRTNERTLFPEPILGSGKSVIWFAIGKTIDHERRYMLGVNLSEVLKAPYSNGGFGFRTWDLGLGVASGISESD
jgi:hypothetical protein